MRRSDRNFTKIPDGKLGIIALEGCKELGKTIDNYIIQWRSETYKDFKDSVACDGYLRDTYLMKQILILQRTVAHVLVLEKLKVSFANLFVTWIYTLLLMY